MGSPPDFRRSLLREMDKIVSNHSYKAPLGVGDKLEFSWTLTVTDRAMLKEVE